MTSRMNNYTKLMFALEHVAHLEDYIERESPLYHPLTTIKFELEKQLKHEESKGRKNDIKISHY